jgi:O-antigen/teichoic acid export membrane protein
MCSFVRNVVLARLISPSNFGIAATFAITYSLLEMLSSLSADKLLIQSAHGEDPRLENTAHTFNATRACMNALIIFSLAGPLARLFGVPDAKAAFQYLALMPLLRGFAHLDPSRMQRAMRFGPVVLVDAATSVFVTLLALPLGYWLRNYNAMLILLIIQSAVSTTLSHLVAERRYCLSWAPQYAKEMASFGWPLLINALLMFGIFEGDRLVIGASHRLFSRSIFTLNDLGLYSAAFALTMAPTMFVANVCNSLFLPLFSQVKSSVDQFRRRYSACAEIVAMLSIGITIPLIVAGGKCIVLIYGQRYSSAGQVVGWLAVMWGLRMIRVTPTLGAMALGDTRNAMISNIFRSFAFPSILCTAALGLGFKWVAICGAIGEVLATGISLIRLQVRDKVPASLCMGPASVGAGAAIMAALCAKAEGAAWFSAVGVSLVLVLAAWLIMLGSFPHLWQDILSILRRRTIIAAEESSLCVSSLHTGSNRARESSELPEVRGEPGECRL